MCQRFQKSLIDSASERQAEVRRGADAEDVRRPHRHRRVAGEVEEQAPGVQVHVRERAGPSDRPVQLGGEPRGEDELIHGAQEHQRRAATEEVGVLVARPHPVRVLLEPAQPVDRAAGQRREKHHEEGEVRQRQLLDQAVGDLQHDRDDAERQVRDAEEAEEPPQLPGRPAQHQHDHDHGRDPRVRTEPLAEQPEHNRWRASQTEDVEPVQRSVRVDHRMLASRARRSALPLPVSGIRSTTVSSLGTM